MKKLLFIIKNPNEASSRFRVIAYLRLLESDYSIDIFYSEYHNTRIPKFLRSIVKRTKYLSLLLHSGSYDVIYMQRPMSSDRKRSVFFEKLLVTINPNLIFDFDDALFLHNETKIIRLVSLARLCVCGNKYLNEFATRYNRNTHIIPTSIDTDVFTPEHRHDKDNITIGWTGTSGNYQFFTNKMIREINSILEKYAHVNFLFICDKKPDERFNFPYDFTYWNESTEVSDLRKIDIGLMPLSDSAWSRGKCGFKLIQYGATGIPSVGSDVGVNSEVIIDNRTGILCRNDNWLEPLEKLINDPVLRLQMGHDARLHIQENYSISANYGKLRHVLSLVTDE